MLRRIKPVTGLFPLLLLTGIVYSVPAFSAGATRTVTVQVMPQFNGQPLTLSTKEYVSEAGDTVRIDRFRFYLSSIQLLLRDGTIYSEKESYHLVDAENENSLEFMLPDVPQGKILGIQFSVGVDSMKCISGAFGGDLDPANGMYWAWNSGYIHAKLEGSSPSCKTHRNAFEFHIGGFASPNSAIRSVRLPVNRTTDRLVIAADAHYWIKDLSLAEVNSVVIPGKQAMKIADTYTGMFSLSSE